MFLSVNKTSLGQFAPAAGIPGTSAIHKDSSAIVAWGSQCQIQRGWQNIADTLLGRVNQGLETDAIGPADGLSVVSLGDGGEALITFNSALFNGQGPDMAVFENAFSDEFLELAFVEVSSDGFHFFRFPSTTLVQDTVQTGSFGLTQPQLIHNLAGKYRVHYGTPFDFDDLPVSAFLNKDSVVYVKIIDVTGSILEQYQSYDASGNTINDPWPTPFNSGGFDLDAVAVLHQLPAGTNELSKINFTISPNPAIDIIYLSGNLNNSLFTIYDIYGNTVLQGETKKNISVHNLSPGVYLFSLKYQNNIISVKRFIKN